MSSSPFRLALRDRRSADTSLGRLTQLAWQLLVVGFAAYFAVLILEGIYIVVLPLGIALLFTALLRPAVKRLRNTGMRSVWATWLTILLFWALLAAVFYGAGLRAVNEWPKLSDEATTTIQQLRTFAITHLHIKGGTINRLSDQAVAYLDKHRTALAGGALTGAKLAGEIVTGGILAFFIGFFLLYDGESIFRWLLGFTPARVRDRIDVAGHGAWRALSGYIRGTLIVAIFHGCVMGTALFIMGVPLALPLALLIAFGSLIPLIGAVVFGGLAVLVTLVTHGWVLALVLVGVLILENQAEAHILQPFVVGRQVHLHPLAIALVLTIGTVWGGIWGALFAVPFTAAAWAAYVAVQEALTTEPVESLALTDG